LETDRLVFRRPVARDAQAIFDRYASDPDVTRYLSWLRHSSVDDARSFIEFSDVEWAKWNSGPLLVFSRRDGMLLGGSGLLFETPWSATTGYVFARDVWGLGYATETLRAMVDLAASRRVMEKCGFEREGVLRRHTVFPNISPEPADVLSYSKFLGSL
jgi:RimJ/RimL family protein N-acetyltransferase